jgi:ABC-type uncharacterized transport system auxiliary subunit
MVRHRPVMAAAVLAALALGRCTLEEIPKDHFYRLSPDLGKVPQTASPLPGGVVVDRPEADGLLAERAIPYVGPEAPSTLQTFSYHLWAVPPAIMLQDLFVRCLRAGAVAAEVLTPDLRVSTRYTLLSRLQRMELQTGLSRQVVLSLDIGLRDDKKKALVVWQTFAAQAVPRDASVDAAAAAFSVAFSQICGQLIARLSESGAITSEVESRTTDALEVAEKGDWAWRIFD